MYSTWHALGLKSAHKLLGVARVLQDAGLITAVGCSVQRRHAIHIYGVLLLSSLHCALKQSVTCA